MSERPHFIHWCNLKDDFNQGTKQAQSKLKSRLYEFVSDGSWQAKPEGQIYPVYF